MPNADEIVNAFEKDKELLKQLSDESKNIIIAACTFSEMDNSNSKTSLGKIARTIIFTIKLMAIFKPCSDVTTA